MLSTRSLEQHGMLVAKPMLLLWRPVAVRGGQPPTAAWQELECRHKFGLQQGLNFSSTGLILQMTFFKVLASAVPPALGTGAEAFVGK